MIVSPGEKSHSLVGFSATEAAPCRICTAFLPLHCWNFFPVASAPLQAWLLLRPSQPPSCKSGIRGGGCGRSRLPSELEAQLRLGPGLPAAPLLNLEQTSDRWGRKNQWEPSVLCPSSWVSSGRSPLPVERAPSGLSLDLREDSAPLPERVAWPSWECSVWLCSPPSPPWQRVSERLPLSAQEFYLLALVGTGTK